MFHILLALVLAASVTDCREAAQGVHLEKFGGLAKSLPKLPSPRRSPPPGSGIISFEITAEGRARSIDVECQSSELTGNYLKGLISVTRFHTPTKMQRGIRHTVGLNVDVSEDANVKISVTDFPDSAVKNK